ncbi:DegT/DnrJ/EryC1/StrS family aminotransferase [Enterobacteriaceae bacterium H16N7]|nr:DegT/DnrJ/EryC1/StrS family aminotransferase [Dryocola clanedunensis]
MKNNTHAPITVTKPFLPPLSEFMPYLEEIWRSGTLTNGGHFHQQLESALADYLKVPYISLFTNATIALIVAMQTLRIKGEVITTPYSFVATAHSVLWNQLKPVFVDVDPVSCNIDPERIEEAITAETSLIMPVHVYGRACQVEKIDNIAKCYGLKTIYDAAHAFGVEDNEGSILRHGDLSILSFHATKVFNTFEGGAIISPDLSTKRRIDFLKNFGFADEVTVVAPGINGKMNEVQAAFGLLQLGYVDDAIARRQAIDTLYRQQLKGITGIRLPADWEQKRNNHSYFPIFVEPDYPLSRDALYEKFKQHNILARRYFYPLISELNMYHHLPSARRQNLPVANRLAEEVLCLPIYPDLDRADVWKIIELVATP